MASATLRAVILTALSVEFEAVREFLPDSQVVRHSAGTMYERGTFQGNGRTWEVGIAEVGMGDAGAALETERAISFFDPQVILFVGIAGGIKDVEIGDVVASTKIYGYESGKAKETFEPRPELGLSSYALIEQAKAEKRSRSQEWLNRLPVMPEPRPKVEVGAIAAGEKVIGSTQSSVYKFLRAQYGDALAVEMEGYGFLKATHANERRAAAIVVRGISDLIDHKNEGQGQESEAARKIKASRHASAFAFQLLANFDPYVRVTGTPKSLRTVAPQVWDELFNCFQEDDLPIIGSLFEEQLTPLQRDPYPELSQLNTLQMLRTVVEQIDDLAIAVAWVGRIIHTAENPLAGEPLRPVSPVLRAWYEARRPPESEPEPAKKPHSYLLIALDPRDDEGTVSFTAEVQSADGEVLKTDLLPRDAKCTIGDPSQYLTQAINKAGGEVKTVEFFLSWQHFGQLVHEWKVERAFKKRYDLKLIKNTLIRSLDRLTYEDEDLVADWLSKLTTQWQCLQDSSELSLDYYCHEETTVDFQALGDVLLQKPQCLILKLLSVLPEDPNDLQKLLSDIFESGIPVWLWLNSTPSASSDVSELSNAITTLLASNDTLREPALLAAALRRDQASLSNLGLLCECPHRLPVLVDWKKGRLRQPAA